MASEQERREQLLALKQEFEARLERIQKNVQRGLSADSEERAKELEDQDVVDALGNEAAANLAKINAALKRLEAGDYGQCVECGGNIQAARLDAYPYAARCIDCAA
jgi:DnaK suppressor protein